MDRIIRKAMASAAKQPPRPKGHCDWSLAELLRAESCELAHTIEKHARTAAGNRESRAPASRKHMTRSSGVGAPVP